MEHFFFAGADYFKPKFISPYNQFVFYFDAENSWLKCLLVPFCASSSFCHEHERKILKDTINSLLRQIRIINDSLPDILREIKLIHELPGSGKVEKEKLVKLSYTPESESRRMATVKDSDKKRFLSEISLSNRNFKRIEGAVDEKNLTDFTKPRIYAKISNKFFSSLSSSFVDKGYFKDLGYDLKKANMSYIIGTYISMMIFSIFLAFVLGIGIFILLLAMKQSIQYIWLIPGLPLAAGIAFYFYPFTERKSIENRINYELPFVVIHMSAIAGSGIEPSNIFRIIAKSKEYKYVSFEIKKVINQTNLYGLDLVTALKNSAKVTSSLKLAELFNGLATNISSGGKLNEFFEKRAESLLLDYRLDREKYVKSVDMLMNIYIGVVFTAPFIMMMLLILLNLTNIGIGMSTQLISFIMVGAVCFVNVLFIMFLGLRQPNY